MKRFALLVCAALGLLLSAESAYATGWTYGGHQPWYNVFARRNKCLTPEEKRLQRFWHDYYHALKCYYGMLDNLDWVAYYKNHGYVINQCCAPCGPGGCGPCGPSCCPRINYAPVFVTPGMNWAIPNTCMSGPPCGPAACGPMGCGN
jgi:hypothetical protein